MCTEYMVCKLYISIYLSIPRWVNPKVPSFWAETHPTIPSSPSSSGAMVKKIKKGGAKSKKSKGLSAGFGHLFLEKFRQVSGLAKNWGMMGKSSSRNMEKLYKCRMALHVFSPKDGEKYTGFTG